jgi:hypothetical protein
MKHVSSIKKMMVVLTAFGMVACASNPNKAKKIETEMEKSDKVTGVEKLGVKDGNLVFQRKVEMSEELRDLQNGVYSAEDRVYGNRKYGSQGLYGTLKLCRAKLSSRDFGGNGKLMWTEPIDRVTDKEEEYEIGIDEQEKIVAVSEEFLKDRIKRFRGYKALLQKREDEYQEKLEICDAEVSAREADMKEKREAKKAASGAATDADAAKQ